MCFWCVSVVCLLCFCCGLTWFCFVPGVFVAFLLCFSGVPELSLIVSDVFL